MTRAVTERAKALAREFEGFRSDAYRCPSGVLTIGYGHTKGVREGLSCTKRQAELWLTEDFADAARSLEGLIGPALVAELTDNQHDALCDFIFNLGLQPKATLWKRLKAKDFDAVPAQLSRFVYSGKTKLNGLVRRRNAEVALWSEDEPGSHDGEANSAELRVVETPPALAEKPKAAPLVTGALAVCSTVPVAAQSVQKAIEPYVSQSEIVAKVWAIVATIAAAAAVGVLLLNWIQHRSAKR